MSRKKRQKIEYRYYEMPAGAPALALLGEKWIRNYGCDVDVQHFHNYMEIGFCHFGDGTLTIGETDHHYGGEMFTIIPKNITHNTASKEDGMCYWEYLFIDTDKFLKDVYKNNLSMAERLLNRIEKRAYIYQVQEKKEIADTILWIMNVMREKRELYLEEARGGVLSLLIMIAREDKNCEQQQGERKGNTAIIKPALDYITQHFEHQVKIDFLAELCHISETHFRRVFKECMNMSPVEYINWVRIKMACDELKCTNDSISAIAVRTGFGTLSTFNRNFRRIMGITPQQLRQDPENYEQKLLNYDIKREEGW